MQAGAAALGPHQEPAVGRPSSLPHQREEVVREVGGDAVLAQQLAGLLVVVEGRVEDVERRVVPLLPHVPARPRATVKPRTATPTLGGAAYWRKCLMVTRMERPSSSSPHLKV